MRKLLNKPLNKFFLPLAFGFWLIVCLVLGPGHHLLDFSYPPLHLESTFRTWDSVGITQHGFLTFLTPDSYAAGEAYLNLSLPYLLLHYGLFKFLGVLGIDYSVADNFLVFFYLIPCFLLAQSILGRDLGSATEKNLPDQLWKRTAQFMAIGLVATLPSLWIALIVRYAFHLYSLSAFWFCAYAIEISRGQANPKRIFIWMIIAAAVCPLSSPLMALAYFFGQSSSHTDEPRSSAKHLLRSLVPLGVGAFFLILPFITFWVMGFSVNRGSGFLFRSGLDGDTTYLTSILQAFLNPWEAPVSRPWNVYLLPLVALTLIGLHHLLNFTAHRSATLLRVLFLGMLPYFYFLVLIPQCVVVHPYHFDFCLILPAALFILYWITQQASDKIGPVLKIYLLLLLGGALMTQLIELKRALP